MQAPAFGAVGYAGGGSFVPPVTTYAGAAFAAHSHAGRYGPGGGQQMFGSGNLVVASASGYGAGAATRSFTPGPPLLAEGGAGGPQGATVPAFLETTMEELKGERSVHGLNSSHCLLPMPAGSAGLPTMNGAMRPPGAFPEHTVGMQVGMPWSVGVPPNSRPAPPVSGRSQQTQAGREPFHGWTPGMPQMDDRRGGQQGMPSGFGGFNSFAPPMNSADMRRSPPPGSRPTREMPPERELTNGFKDSSDYVDAGDDAESEFLSSRADLSSRNEDYPPPKVRSRTKGKRDDALTCMPCFVSTC